MVKVIFILMLPLVLLGFLIHNTIDMHGELGQLKNENQKLLNELSQLRSNYEMVVQERDDALAANANLKYQFDAMQTAYLAENQARIKAESDLEAYKSMFFNMSNNSQAVLPPVQYIIDPGQLLRSNIAPVGASFLITLVVVSWFFAMFKHAQKQKK